MNIQVYKILSRREGAASRILNISWGIWVANQRGVTLPQSPPRPSGWITRDYREDGSLIDIKTKDFDIAFIYFVVIFCILIAVGGLAWDESTKGSNLWWHYAAMGIAGGIALVVVIYFMYFSMQVKRVRIDQRGLIYTIGKKLEAKLPWDDVGSIKCYERNGGFTMSKTIRGIEFTTKHPEKSIMGGVQSLFKMESDLFGQESLDKAVKVIQFYHEKHDFKAQVDKWESGEKYILSGKSPE